MGKRPCPAIIARLPDELGIGVSNGDGAGLCGQETGRSTCQSIKWQQKIR
jgi:hypothetical protein